MISNRGGGYSHRIFRLGGGRYRLMWAYDRRYAGDRKNYPRNFMRVTDEAGARRFSERWGVPMPKDEAA